MRAIVYHERTDVDHQLSRLGLERHQIVRAVKVGYLGRTSCTRDHPRNYPGLHQYAETTRELRGQLKSGGWTGTSHLNMEITLSPQRGIGISVVSGNEDTGISQRTPSTKRKRGAVTSRLVDGNQQLKLDLPVPDQPPMTTEDGQEVRQTWVLLHYFDRSELRFELSVPFSIGDDGFIGSWKERIIFPPEPIGDSDLPVLPEYAEQPDVNINPKK